jgi:hypothetical protein
MTMSSQVENGATRQMLPSGGAFAAEALLLTSGLLTFLVGVFALSANELVVAGPGYEYTFQLSGWGWVNILTGMVLAAVSIAVFLGATCARVTAIIATCLAIVVTFLWMPYYPTGSIVLIVLDVVAVWGVATWNTSGKSA